MKIVDTKLDGVKVIEPTFHGDHRGWFIESYNDEKFKELGLEVSFIQDNHSYSAKKGTLRGLHYQLYPKAQTKLVRCTRGRIFDVAVDIRRGSLTYGKWFGIELSEENKKQLLVPKGFAHGFLTLTDDVEVQYKVDELYSPEHDRNIRWDDKDLSIDWKINNPILSNKDELAPGFKDSYHNFSLKALVTGANGQLGYDVVKKLKKLGFEVHGTDRETMDITNLKQVKQLFASLRPNVVVHCAAYTEVDRAESDCEKCYEVNVRGTELLAKESKVWDSKFIYISSDYVFDGKGNEARKEEEPTSPINYYGYTKELGEKIVRNVLNNHFIVRTSWVYGENGNNFVKTMLRLAKTNSTLRIVNDQIGSPTYTKDLADLIGELVMTEHYGTYHGVNRDVCSWADFAKAIFEISNQKISIIPVSSEEYPTDALRPKNSRLSTDKIRNTINYQMPHWKNALTRYLTVNSDEENNR